MPQRSLASLVLAPVFLGILSLALACVAGERTDRLGDTLTATDTLHVVSDVMPDTIVQTAPDSAAATQDTVALQQGAAAESPKSIHHHARAMLSPRADSIADELVFVPRNRVWFTVASRGQHLLVDIGRADLPGKLDSLTRDGYLEAVSALSPLPLGSVLRLRGPWGSEDAPVSGFDLWNGRIVARVQVSRALQAMARRKDYLPGIAVRLADSSIGRPLPASDSTAPAGQQGATTAVMPKRGPRTTAQATPAPVCHRDSVAPALLARGEVVRDSLVRFLTDSMPPPYERLALLARVQSWTIPGCFGRWHVLVMANKRTPEMEFAVERLVLLDSAGQVLPVRLSDLRFHAHVPTWVFDADGDGIDDLAARAYGDRSGGLSIARLDTTARRFARLTSGFAWER
ncbi:MAG TPA: hypothetical protein VJU87_09315 [Gemmatimonadaceae bacterium]|nr:hypothetical protein [Gemmatimonadaceae bacterium]